jgi:antitoxin MazE
MKTNNAKDVFSMIITAEKWRNGIGVCIPQKVAEKYGVVDGSEIQITEDKDSIILKPITNDPTLEELLAQVTDENRHSSIDWGKPKGNEVW